MVFDAFQDGWRGIRDNAETARRVGIDAAEDFVETGQDVARDVRDNCITLKEFGLEIGEDVVNNIDFPQVSSIRNFFSDLPGLNFQGGVNVKFVSGLVGAQLGINAVLDTEINTFSDLFPDLLLDISINGGIGATTGAAVQLGGGIGTVTAVDLTELSDSDLVDVLSPGLGGLIADLILDVDSLLETPISFSGDLAVKLGGAFELDTLPVNVLLAPILQDRIIEDSEDLDALEFFQEGINLLDGAGISAGPSVGAGGSVGVELLGLTADTGLSLVGNIPIPDTVLDTVFDFSLGNLANLRGRSQQLIDEVSDLSENVLEIIQDIGLNALRFAGDLGKNIQNLDVSNPESFIELIPDFVKDSISDPQSIFDELGSDFFNNLNLINDLNLEDFGAEDPNDLTYEELNKNLDLAEPIEEVLDKVPFINSIGDIILDEDASLTSIGSISDLNYNFDSNLLPDSLKNLSETLRSALPEELLNDEEGFNTFFEDQFPFLANLIDEESIEPEVTTQPEFTTSSLIQTEEEDQVGEASLTIPTFTLSNEAEYTIDLSSAASDGANLNFAYIIDVSSSMSGTEITEAKEAYVSLTDSLGEAANTSRFAVIPFNSSANTFGPLDATEAIEKIESLSAGGGTNFGPPVVEATEFFEGLSSGTNIAYFLSDGRGSLPTEQEIAALQEDADIRAFGIGNADRDSLEQIDSDGSVPILDDPADLTAEFETSGFNRDAIDEIDISVDGKVIDTLESSDLEDTSVGLSFSGTLTDLDTSGGQDNEIKAEISFKEEENINDTTIITSISDGGTSVIIDNVKRLGRDAIEGIAQAGEEVFGNLLDNNLTAEGDEATLNGGGGNNTYNIEPDAQDVTINGNPDGEDTVRYEETQEERGSPRKVGEVTEVDDNTDTLINVDFIEFSDQRLDISGDDIENTPPSLRISDISVAPNEDVATFTLELSHPIDEAVEVTYETIDGTATAGIDYQEVEEETVTISKQEQTKEIKVDIVDDVRVAPNTTFGVEFSDLQGAVFPLEQDTFTATAEIENDNEPATLSLDFDSSSIAFQQGDDTAPLELTIIREDNLDLAPTVDYEIVFFNEQDELIEPLSDEVAFSPDESESEVVVDLADTLNNLDTVGELDFGIFLDNPSRGATLEDATAFGTATVDPSQEDTVVGLSLESQQLPFTNLDFSILRGNNLEPAKTVDYELTIFDEQGEETNSLEEQVQFNSEDEALDISLDLTQEFPELDTSEDQNFLITLEDASEGSTFLQNARTVSGQLTEDALLSLELENQQIDVSNQANSAPVDFTVIRESNLASTITVDYEISLFDEENGQIDDPLTDTVELEANETEQSFSVDLLQEFDDLNASEEKFFRVELSNPSDGATLTQNARDSGVITNEPFEITSEATITVLETTTDILTIETTNPDEVNLFFLSGGDDEEFFTIDEETGQLSFEEARDFDDQSASGDNTYEVEVGAVDEQGLFNSQTFEVEVKPNTSEPDDDTPAGEEVFRFFNTATGGHFYTASEEERDFVEDTLSDFVFEGTAFFAYEESLPETTPVFRFFNGEGSGHFYTASAEERDFVQEDLTEFELEGIGFYANPISEAELV